MCRLSEAARLLLAACAFAASVPAPALTAARPADPVRSVLRTGPLGTLDDLRNDAALDHQARSALARRLLDRFEAVGDRAALHEALRWIARDWDEQALLRGGPVNRIVVGDCARPGLQRHWACDGGD